MYGISLLNENIALTRPLLYPRICSITYNVLSLNSPTTQSIYLLQCSCEAFGNYNNALRYCMPINSYFYCDAVYIVVAAVRL